MYNLQLTDMEREAVRNGHVVADQQTKQVQSLCCRCLSLKCTLLLHQTLYPQALVLAAAVLKSQEGVRLNKSYLLQRM